MVSGPTALGATEKAAGLLRRLRLRRGIGCRLILSARNRQRVKECQQGCAAQQGCAPTAAINFEQHRNLPRKFVRTRAHTAALLSQQIAGRLA